MARILVADDDRDIRELLAHLLTKDGHEVHLALDGTGAVQEASARRHDLVILDFHMPGRTGAETARAIRSIPGYQATPMMLLTASATRSEIDSALAAGVDVQRDKPVDLRELRRLIGDLLDEASADPA